MRVIGGKLRESRVLLLASILEMKFLGTLWGLSKDDLFIIETSRSACLLLDLCYFFRSILLFRGDLLISILFAIKI